MCSNYKSVTAIDHLVAHFGVARSEKPSIPEEWKADVFPLYLAPYIRLDELGRRRVASGQFGLLPHWSKERSFGRQTYNARSESVATKPSFRDAWRRSQRCIIPVEEVYEPCYLDDNDNPIPKPVRHAIVKVSGAPMGIAGIWADHPTMKRDNGEPVESFAMLTVSGEGHPVFQRMHGPMDEKRMVVILDPEDYDEWLTCSPEDAKQYFRQYKGELRSFPKPLPPRKKKVPEPPFPPVAD